MEALTIHYRFEVEDGTSTGFSVALEPGSLLARPPEGGPPAWTRLSFHQCPNCPLDPEKTHFCPSAIQLPGLVAAFDHLFSYEKARVEVTTSQRVIYRDTTVQQGLGALLGLLMATSGCPHTAFFRPMARFHLPFADPEETTFRAASTFLLAAYFRGQKRGESPSCSLEGLTEVYREMHEVNKAMAHRIRAATTTDSAVNALIVLDMFTVLLPMEVECQLTGLAESFGAFLE